MDGHAGWWLDCFKKASYALRTGGVISEKQADLEGGGETCKDFGEYFFEGVGLFIISPREGEGCPPFTLGNEQVACSDDVHADEHVGFVVDDIGFHSPDGEWRYCGFYDDDKFIDGAFSHGAYTPKGGLCAWA